MKVRFEGIIPPLTTPFSEDGQILYDSLQRNVERYLQTPLPGLLFLGSNGEATHLSSRERVELVKKVENWIARHIRPSPREAIIRAESTRR